MKIEQVEKYIDPEDLAGLRSAAVGNRFWRLEKVKVKLIDHCNMRCLKCNHWVPERRPTADRTNPLSREEWLNIAPQLNELGVKKVSFTGGEPTLHPGLVDIIRVLSQGGARCSLTTNGSRLTGGLGRSLIEAGLRQMRLSIDGPTAQIHDQSVGVSGAFENLKQGVAEVKAAAESIGSKLKININTVVCGLNIDRIEELVHLTADWGARELLLMGLHQSHLSDERMTALDVEAETLMRWRDEALPALIQLGRSLGVKVSALKYVVNSDGSVEDHYIEQDPATPCYMAWFNAAVFPAGDVLVCCHSRHKALLMGNLRDQTLADILHGERAGKVRQACLAPAKVVPDCRTCDVYEDRLTLAELIDGL